MGNTTSSHCQALATWAQKYGNNAERAQRQRIREAHPQHVHKTINSLAKLLTIEAASTLIYYSTRLAQLMKAETPDDLYDQIIAYLGCDEGLDRARGISTLLTGVILRDHGFYVPLPALKITNCARDMMNILFQESPAGG